MIDLAIEMNNVGVKFLCAGRDQEALDQFQGALQLLMFKAQGHHYFPANERVNRAHMSLLRYHREASTSYDAGIQMCERDETIFSRALRIDEQLSYFFLETSGSSHDCHHLLSATMLFNAAVTLHLQPADKGLPRAESFYRLSYELLTSPNPAARIHSTAENLLSSHLVLAILNNLTQINYNMGRYDLAKSLITALCAFSSSIPLSTSSTLSNDKNRALLNSLFMSDPPTTSGAA